MGVFGNKGKNSFNDNLKVLKRKADFVVGSRYSTRFEVMENQPMENQFFLSKKIVIVGAIKNMQFENCDIELTRGLIQNCVFKNCLFKTTAMVKVDFSGCDVSECYSFKNLCHLDSRIKMTDELGDNRKKFLTRLY
jgi:hypothetical protein